MSLPLLLGVTIAYLYTAIEQTYRGNASVGLMFAGYAVANIGIIGVMK